MIKRTLAALVSGFALAWLIAVSASVSVRAVYSGEDIITGSFTANTSTGAQSVTGLGATPKAIIFYTNFQNANTLTDGAGPHSMGWTDCTNEGVVMSWSLDNQFNWDAKYSQSTADIIRSIDTTPTVNYEANFTSCDADGFTINWDTTAAGTLIVNYIAFTGSGLSAFAGTFAQPNAAGSQSVTGVGFEPELVFAMTGVQGVTNASATADGGTDFSFGMANATQEVSLCVRTTDNATGTVGRQRSDHFISLADHDNDNTRDQATLTSLNSDGFTLSWDEIDSTIEEPVFYLALRGVRSYIAASNAPTSNGTQALSGFGFTPVAFLMWGWNRTATTSDSTAAGEQNSSFGLADGTNQRGILYGPEYAVPTTAIRAHYSTDLYRNYDAAATGSSSTLLAAADLQSLDSAGVTLDWTTTDATARQFLYAGLGVETTTPALICWDIVPSTQTICTTIPSNVQDNITRLGTLVSWAFSVAPTISDGVKVTFNPDGTNAGINVGSQAGNPSSLANGDIWYNSTTNLFKCRENGSTVDCINSGGGNIQTLLDGISTTQGVILYYNGTDWVALSPGTSGHFLQTQGASANPQWAAAGGGSVGDLLDWQFIRKTSDESVSNTTNQDDDELALSVSANEIWQFDILLFATNAANTADIKVNFTIPSGATVSWVGSGYAPNGTAQETNRHIARYQSTTAFAIGVLASGTEPASHVRISGLYIGAGNSGTMQLQWAQQTTDGSNATVVKADSYLMARCVSGC